MKSFDHELASVTDHTLLRPEATAEEIERLCGEAMQYGFATVCVNSSWAPLCVERLMRSHTKVCTVVGFPLGAMCSEAKVAEAHWALKQEVDEIDMVLHVGQLKAGNRSYVRHDIEAVIAAAKGCVVKVILETALLTDGEKIAACEVAMEAGAHFVKTSTGFGPGGATVEDVRLMRGVVGDRLGVKASGGIRDRATALRMIEAGATRLGTSASVAIVTGAA